MSLENKPWQEKMLAITVLYFIIDKKQELSVLLEEDLEFAEPILQKMYNEKLLDIEHEKYIATDLGEKTFEKTYQAIDVIRQFDVFGTVNVARELSEEEYKSNKESLFVKDIIFDPRFNPDDPEAIDMRLAVLSWIVGAANNKSILKNPINPEEVVYLQRLGTGQLQNDSLWFNLRSGEIFKDIDKTIEASYKWTDIDPSSSDNASKVMEVLYKAGMIENRKRFGSICGNCNSPLVFFEQQDSALDSCPNCHNILKPAPIANDPGTISCPKCKSIIFQEDTFCGGCGAIIDYSMPMGTIENNSSPVFETCNYISYGWLPYDPYFDLLVFDCLVYNLW